MALLQRGWRLDEIRNADRAAIDSWLRLIAPPAGAAAAPGAPAADASAGVTRSAGWKARLAARQQPQQKP